MTKLTLIAGRKCSGEAEVTVSENGEKSTYLLPVGVELTVSDAVAQAAAKQYECLLGYYVKDENSLSSLPTDGIAQGSYCFVMQTGIVKFLSDGAWR